MSATLDIQLFESFFTSAPVLRIPGRTFPVAKYYLEDLLDATNHMIEEGSRYAIRDYYRSETVSLMVTAKGGEKKRQVASVDSELDQAVSDDYPGYKLSTRRYANG